MNMKTRHGILKGLHCSPASCLRHTSLPIFPPLPSLSPNLNLVHRAGVCQICLKHEPWHVAHLDSVTESRGDSQREPCRMISRTQPSGNFSVSLTNR
ncbi:hypothetical protein E2C01_004209 [Portunus trituberculatus]|uniref:Uncharacterized protein n=1 Tax=Portunus trituberculatus TaxID=210409 RepID=A0A5B7CRS8_PORTR|nr:hypothetical protein [Portunus trituberculatus]